MQNISKNPVTTSVKDLKAEIKFLQDDLQHGNASAKLAIKECSIKKNKNAEVSLSSSIEQDQSKGQNDLEKKCRKYNKLIHKLREKIALLQARIIL